MIIYICCPVCGTVMVDPHDAEYVHMTPGQWIYLECPECEKDLVFTTGYDEIKRGQDAH